MIRLIVLIWLLFVPRLAWGGEVTVAVASNFLTTAEKIVAEFEAATGHAVTLSHGSTGQLHAQIVSGAPFDVFLSADAARPARLDESDLTREVRTYAVGRLVLVSRMAVARETAPDDLAGLTVALADPTVAPYGLAATRAMEGLRLDTATFRPVLLANVGQVAVVFATGNAEAAFVSEAQLPVLAPPHVMDLEGLYPPVVQDAALLLRAADNEAALAFWEWLFSERGRGVIEAAGFALPE